MFANQNYILHHDGDLVFCKTVTFKTSENDKISKSHYKPFVNYYLPYDLYNKYSRAVLIVSNMP
jgi:hypothetical protein